MDNAYKQLLKALKARKKPFQITVTGFSMNPVIYEGDIITTQPQNDYQIGDILVFDYPPEDVVLVHRLLKKGEGIFFCKGDNCYRLEEVTLEQIVGKVTYVNDKEIDTCPPRLISLSYAVNRQFVSLGHSSKRTNETDVYKLFKKIYLDMGEDPMVYQTNKEMEYIQTDETSLAVFDHSSGDTHLFDEQGINILNLLEEPRDLESLLNKLCEIYDISPNDIKSDVEGFLEEAIDKRIVFTL